MGSFSLFLFQLIHCLQCSFLYQIITLYYINHHITTPLGNDWLIFLQPLKEANISTTEISFCLFWHNFFQIVTHTWCFWASHSPPPLIDSRGHFNVPFFPCPQRFAVVSCSSSWFYCQSQLVILSMSVWWIYSLHNGEKIDQIVLPLSRSWLPFTDQQRRLFFSKKTPKFFSLTEELVGSKNT